VTAAALHLLLCLLPQGQSQEPASEPTLRPMAVPRAAAAHRAGRPIQVDGSLLDWRELPPLDLGDPRQLSGTAQGAWRAAEDLSGMAFLLWDEEDLYFAASVRDDWHRALDEKAARTIEIPAADSIVLTFDPERDTSCLGPDPGRVDDASLWLAEESSHQLVRWDRLRGTARAVQGGRQVVSHDKERGITTYEARIPWREVLPVGRKPEDGLVFDLQVVINDYDESTDPMPQTRIGWTFGCGARVDPGLFGSVMLVTDLASLRGRLPEIAPRQRPRGELPPGSAYWTGFAQRLSKAPPAVFAGDGSPEAAGGLERFRLLEELDRHYETFPRVDYLEWNHRVHRRMTREIAGAVERGLPCFWYAEMQRLSLRAEEVVPDGTVRLFALPQHGWLVRSNKRNFAIDPAGPDLAHFLWGGMEFVILTQPLDMTRRSDQLLVRMATADPPRPFLTHAVFHLPWVKMADMRVTEPGQVHGQPGATQVIALGSKQPDGTVPYALDYRVKWPGGKTLLVAGPMLTPEEAGKEPCDLCILSARNPRAAEVGRAARAALVVLDDVFVCETFPGVSRSRLRDALEVQRLLAPAPSILLAPGESWDLP
jgi:hypothetical protein